jgi:phosphate:Na+ symporter
MVLLNIAGGVALILFGIRFLRKGLERLLGHGLHAWLERMAQRPARAAVAGFAFGSVAPSSTAQTLLTLQLLNAGKLSAESMLGFLLGANLGITVMVQLIAFRIYSYYALFLVAGLIAFQFMKSETVRGIGQTVLGIGFIFLAMNLITAAARGLTGNSDFQVLLGVLVNHRLLLVGFAAVVAFLTQSSTATIGLALALSETGVAGLSLLMPVVLGANLGIGLTSLVAGFHTWAGRRLAATNLLLKMLVIAGALAFFTTLEAWFAQSPGALARQGANFHTAFNIVVTVIGVVLAVPLGRLMQRAVKPGQTSSGLKPIATHLDKTALASPVFALACAGRETLRLADEVKSMLESSWQALVAHDAELAKDVRKHDDRIDELNAAIKLYLSQIPTDTMTPRDSQLQFGLLNFSSQLESIGDVVDKNICGPVLAHARDGVQLHPDDRVALDTLYQKVLRRFETAISVLATRDRELAREFLKEGDALKEWCIETQKTHYARLATSVAQQEIVASTRFIDALNVLRRISGQLNTIGHTFVLQPAAAADDTGAG